MDDLKTLTVRYLRELARKHLGPGHSKLRTKEELMAALSRARPALAQLAGKARSKVSPAGALRNALAKATRRKAPPEVGEPSAEPAAQARPAPAARAARKAAKAPAVAATSSPRHVAKAAPKQAAKAGLSAAALAKAAAAGTKLAAGLKAAAGVKAAAKRPAEPRKKAAGDGPAKAPLPPVREPAPVSPHVAREPPGADNPPPPGEPASPGAGQPVAAHPAEPLVEGFFVARVAGEAEARRHGLSGPAGARGRPAETGGDEDLGELPLAYAGDTAVLLPRDPNTLFVFWDFSRATCERAAAGLQSPRAVLRIFDGEAMVREVDFAIESRSFYLHGLPPGRPYRVEAHFVGVDGRSRRIGPSTNRAVLPSLGRSPDTSVRFLRMPPPASAQAHAHASPAPVTRAVPRVEEREYITWHRVALPGSAGEAQVPDLRRERREIPPEGGAPARPPHLEVSAPPLGASERAPAPAARAGHLELPVRPPGASEQMPPSRPAHLELPERALGASEQRPIAPPRSGRSGEGR